MIEIGKINTLRICKEVDFGMYLDGGEEFGEILLPKRYVPSDVEVDQYLDVFIYLDSEDRLIATTEEPLAKVGEFAYLKVVDITKVGAFLDWGLMKDLLVPFSEQHLEMSVGLSYLVYIYMDDETDRVVASSKTDRFLDNIPSDYEAGEEVDLIISNRSDLGIKVIVNNVHSGLLYHNEIFQELIPGQRIKGYVKDLRDDGKLDISLQQSGYDHVEGIAGEILQKLATAGGFLEATDKSSPESIKHTFGVSKKVFKKAIGGLYRERLIEIEVNGIRLVK